MEPWEKIWPAHVLANNVQVDDIARCCQQFSQVHIITSPRVAVSLPHNLLYSRQNLFSLHVGSLILSLNLFACH